jgi:NAD(P)-dependent dehydrogenase (short-subunit alcohol dehydrogenase family)
MSSTVCKNLPVPSAIAELVDALPMVQAIGTDANRRWVEQTPLGWLGRPAEVADLILYLTSEEARFVRRRRASSPGRSVMWQAVC